ncbi:MAG TPA: ATPase, T2SS/T4P/T4SS family [Candidatus Pristimantibacillus sp.]|nr:ATPase, T2SS/T4P/T4SS family [Candidatus Pristimantibacillus sp.]
MGRLLGNAEKFTDKQVSETLTMLVEHGVKRGASDIHIEPHERFVLVRYRIDGVLRGVHKLPRQALGMVMAQLKGLASLNTQDTQMPQEGEYTTDAGGQHIEVRLSTMPVYGGEKAVLHLSQEAGDPVDLAALGFWGTALNNLKVILTSPHGLILVAGPRNSGVSSTLFSLLKDLNSPLVNIATVESDARHRLPGINQTYLGGGMSTQDGLQAALKQDPNIIMVDNIPDGATANLAVHAATTGHLVIAGLHADGSLSALLRLRHAGVEPYLLMTGLRAGVGQRLVRKLCPDCRERYALSEEECQQLEESFGISTSPARKRLHELEQAAMASLGNSAPLSSTPNQVTHLWRPSEAGCETCGHSGYAGRTAIVEVLSQSDGLHKAMLSQGVASVTALQNAAVKDGFVPMGLDGLIKAMRGITTVPEVLKALSGYA